MSKPFWKNTTAKMLNRIYWGENTLVSYLNNNTKHRIDTEGITRLQMKLNTVW